MAKNVSSYSSIRQRALIIQKIEEVKVDVGFGKQHSNFIVLFVNMRQPRQLYPLRTFNTAYVAAKYRIIRGHNNSFLLFVSSSTCICWIAILFSFTSRSLCGMPSLMSTAFIFSMLERHISSLIVA